MSRNQQPKRPRSPRSRGGSSYDGERSQAQKGLFSSMGYLLLAMGVVGVALVARLVWLQVVDGPRIAEDARTQRTNVMTLQAKRGTIYDRNGNVLATSVECRTLYANPKEVTDPQAVAKVLADNLGGTAQDYLSYLTQDTTFVYIRRKVDTSVADKIRSALAKAELTGLYQLPDMKRVYPYGAVAGQVLGLVGTDGEGLTGLELQYNDILSGKNGERVLETGVGGTPIAGGAYMEEPAQDGTDIVISLDIDIQEIAEKKVEEGVGTYSAETGFATVVDPKNGQILAMCSTPFLDPEDTAEVTPEQLTVRSLTDSYEPGSVMKVLTLAVGLENHSFNLDTSFTVPGKVQVGDDYVGDDDDRKETMAMTPREIMRRSSNVGAVLMGTAEGAQAFSEGIARFGIGQTTGIDYPGEVAGLVTPLDSYTSASLGAMSFGQWPTRASSRRPTFSSTRAPRRCSGRRGSGPAPRRPQTRSSTSCARWSRRAPPPRPPSRATTSRPRPARASRPPRRAVTRRTATSPPWWGSPPRPTPTCSCTLRSTVCRSWPRILRPRSSRLSWVSRSWTWVWTPPPDERFRLSRSGAPRL